MQSLALVIHVALAVGVIGLVLLQHGKGADAGAAFGSGASATVFGARGSASFLTRATTILTFLFFVTSLTLFYLAANRDRGISSVVSGSESVVPAAAESSNESESGSAPAAESLDLPAAKPAESESSDNTGLDLPKPTE